MAAADEFPQTPTPDEPGSMSEPEPSPTSAGGGSGRRPRAAAAAGGATTRRAAPKAKAAPRSPGDSRPTSGPARDLKARLEEMFAGMALIPMAAGDHYSAHVITTRSAHLAEAWADLAKQNPAVKRVLEGLLQGGAWGGVILSTGAIVVPILGHYGMLPPVDPWQGLYGPPPVPQGRRPIVPPPPLGGAGAPPTAAPPIVPPNPRQNGAGTPMTNSDGQGDMTPPVAPGQPAGVVTIAGSRSRATIHPDAGTPAEAAPGPMTPPIAPGQPPGAVTVAGSRNAATQAPGA